MAAKIKEGANGKEKTGSSPRSPPSIEIPRGRRTPKSSLAGSPDRDISILSEKPIPGYLKPTVSSLQESCKHGKKQASESVPVKRLPTRKSLDKSPSPSHLHKTPILASSKEKPVKASSPSPKPFLSSRSFKDSTSKTLRNGKVEPPIRSQSLKKDTGTTKRRKTKAGKTTYTNACSDITEKPVSASQEQEEKELPNEEAPEPVKTEDGELVHHEIPPSADQAPLDSIDIESNINENDKPEECDCSSLEQHELAPENDVIETKDHQDKQNIDREEAELEPTHINEEYNNGEHSPQVEESLSGKPYEEVHGVEGEGGDNNEPKFQIEKEASVGADIEAVPRKLKFPQGKELEVQEDKNGGADRLKFKEREKLGQPEEKQSEKENAPLKRQEVKGKKESPAYNDVIEETATKLVEERKSKVKALVGAFETVIQLQDPEEKGEQNPPPEQ